MRDEGGLPNLGILVPCTRMCGGFHRENGFLASIWRSVEIRSGSIEDPLHASSPSARIHGFSHQVGYCVRIALVAAVNPEHPAASGVQSYVMTLGRKLAELDQEVEILGLGSKPSVIDGVSFVPVAGKVRSAFEFVLALWRHLKRWHDSASIVHAHRPDDLIPFHLLQPRTTKVITLHGVHSVHVKARRGQAAAVVYRMGEEFSLARTRSIICVSPDTRNYFSARYPRLTPRLRIIPAGIDLDCFCPRDRSLARARLGISGDEKIAIYVGRFEPEKDPQSIMDAFSPLREKHPNARLLMVGDGRLDSQLRHRAKSSPESIRILKPMPQDELAWILAASDLLVLASKHEGLPTIALEALACGIPVVGPPVGVLPDVVKPGVSGFLTKTSLELPILMEKALYETSWVRSASRESVRTHGWDKIAPKILEVYRDIAA
jgi:glycosyltransferase involved in cell wall biosynthesis